MLRLIGRVQHYPWGSDSTIPKFAEVEGSGLPFAEVWFGAHSSAPSWTQAMTPWVEVGRAAEVARVRALDEVVEEDPAAVLGAEVARSHGDRLPFLVKLLAAQAPLSLQVHPNREQAQAGWEREEAEGMEPARRTYVDNLPKPETLLALTTTRVLAGFRSPASIARDFARLGEPCRELASTLIAPDMEPTQALKYAFGELLHWDSGRIRDSLAAVAASSHRSDKVTQAHTDESWAEDSLVVARELMEFFPGDIGVVASLFLNPIVLAPGAALSVPAGMLHSYVAGFGLEVMANSNNVVRAGLTGKPIDVDELVHIVDFEPGAVEVDVPTPVVDTAGIWRSDYDQIASEYQLAVYESQDGGVGGPISGAGPRIVVCLAGRVLIRSDQGRVALSIGDAIFAGDGEQLSLEGSGRVAVVGVGRTPAP